jgi:hypothetical protein
MKKERRMNGDRLPAYASASVLDRVVDRQLRAARPASRWTDVTPGAPPYRLLWCRIREDAPSDPPDERYYGDEVRPTGVDSGGHLTWDYVPDGLSQITIHNVAEALAETHGLPPGTIVRVEERLDRQGPPEFVYMTDAAPPAERLARIVSYDVGTYTVQPVRRESAGFASEGPPISNVPNLGELWDDEAGYLAGPTGFDRYVRIFWTPSGWAMLLHPPRMV